MREENMNFMGIKPTSTGLTLQDWLDSRPMNQFLSERLRVNMINTQFNISQIGRKFFYREKIEIKIIRIL